MLLLRSAGGGNSQTEVCFDTKIVRRFHKIIFSGKSRIKIMKRTFVLLRRPDRRMIQAKAIPFIPENRLIYQRSRRCRESQRLNDGSIFALPGWRVGRCSRARNKLKSHTGRKSLWEKTAAFVCKKSAGRGEEIGER